MPMVRRSLIAAALLLVGCGAKVEAQRRTGMDPNRVTPPFGREPDGIRVVPWPSKWKGGAPHIHAMSSEEYPGGLDFNGATVVDVTYTSNGLASLFSLIGSKMGLKLDGSLQSNLEGIEAASRHAPVVIVVHGAT